MRIQQGISKELNDDKIGRTFKVLFDKKEGDYFVGRTEFDSTEVDNEVLVDAAANFVRVGDFANIEITSAEDYDLFGVIAD
jgi:ribosomal protein S12 methylthiotransferase